MLNSQIISKRVCHAEPVFTWGIRLPVMEIYIKKGFCSQRALLSEITFNPDKAAALRLYLSRREYVNLTDCEYAYLRIKSISCYNLDNKIWRSI